MTSYGHDSPPLAHSRQAGHGVDAAFVAQGIGSPSVARIRFAGAPDGPHLHIAVSDAAGKVTGGHMGPGCVVRTTAEVLVMLVPGHRFSREIDPATGYKELFVRPAESSIATSR